MADINYISHANETGFKEVLGIVLPPDGTISDAIHCSNSHSFQITGEEIHGGKEDCVDCNNLTSDGVVNFDKWFSGGKYVCTVKGGAKDLTLIGTIYRHGTECDIDLDNWSDQSHEKTSNIQLNFTTVDGSPVKVISRRGVKPLIMNPEQRYDIDSSMAWWFQIVMTIAKKLHLA